MADPAPSSSSAQPGPHDEPAPSGLTWEIRHILQLSKAFGNKYPHTDLHVFADLTVGIRNPDSFANAPAFHDLLACIERGFSEADRQHQEDLQKIRLLNALLEEARRVAKDPDKSTGETLPISKRQLVMEWLQTCQRGSSKNWYS